MKPRSSSGSPAPSGSRAIFVLALGFALSGLVFVRDARAGSCGDGTCDAGEDSLNCAQDCQCYNTASVDYALCCCCKNGPNPQGQCTPKAVCNYPEIGGCCCVQFDQFDPNTCLFCVDKDEIPNWCGGLGAYEGMGSCGPAAAATCEEPELTDEFVEGVDVRTRCATTSVPLGPVEGGDGFALDVSIVYSEARPPPAELVDGFPNKNTGPYGKGGWLSVDKIFTDEGIYWKNTDDQGQLSATGVLKGSRFDRNGNGYVGYTLHTPFGDRTYDYPLVVKVNGYDKPVGVYRSEPFDGRFLIVRDPTGFNNDKGRKYVLFQYPNGPYEIYDHPLSAPGGPKPFDPNDPVRAASVLETLETQYGPPSQYAQTTGHIHILRGNKNHPSAMLASGKWSLGLSYGAAQPDGGMALVATRIPGQMKNTVNFTQKAGYRPETLASPGRWDNDLTMFEWDTWKIKTIDLQIKGKDKKTAFQAKSTFERDMEGTKIASVTVAETFLGVPQGDTVTRFEACDISGQAFEGTTVSMPHGVKLSFEYGDESMLHRLVAQTQLTGTRTQYAYNDVQTEPRGELTYAVSVEGPTEAGMLGTGFGTQIVWTMLEQSPMDAALFPADTFTGPKTSKGVPVASQLVRRPDGMVLRTMKSYDANVFLPQTIIDERRMTHALTFYADTAQLKSHTQQGLRTDYLRTVEEISVPKDDDSGGAWIYHVQMIETVLTGLDGSKASMGKMGWDMKTGRFMRQINKGLKLDPNDPASGKVQEITIEKRVIRGGYGEPTKMQTIIDGQVTAETVVAWDERLRAPKSATSTLNGQVIAAATPMGGGTDGLGGPVGSWQVSGPQEKLTMFAELDPLGNIQTATANGIGQKLSYGAGPDASTLKTSVARLSPAGEIQESEELETAGTTEPVCK